MSETRGRILDYDVLRAAAALTVVAIHVLSVALAQPHGLVAWRGSTAMELTLWAATPAFAFLTGALVWTMHPPRSGADLGRFFSRRVSVVVVPYVAWSLVYILFVRPMPHIAGARDLAAFAIDAGRRIVFGGGWYHLYFIPVALTLYLLAPLVSRVSRRFPWVLLVAGCALGALHGYVPAAPSAHLVNARNVLVSLLWFLPFAAAGAWYGALRDRVQPWVARLWPLLLAAGLVLRWRDLAGRFMPNPLSQRSFEIVYMLAILLGFFGALQLLRRLAPVVMAPASALAATSYTVYLAHPLAIRGLESAVRALRLEALWGSPLFAFAAIAGVAAFCHACARLALRVPATAWIVRGPLRRRETSPLVSLPAEEPVLETAGEA